MKLLLKTVMCEVKWLSHFAADANSKEHYIEESLQDVFSIIFDVLDTQL